jgi:hypothetical protein
MSVTLITIFSSCDLMKGDESVNKIPIIEFVNVPVPGDTFSYAPRIFWTGFDPDGFVAGYEYFDDSSPAAAAAYDAGDAELATYIASLDANVWVPTDSASQVIFLLTEEGVTQEHIFMIRCRDNLGAYSEVRVRPFSRDNEAPNPPQIRWGLADLRCNGAPYDTIFTVCDTVFWGDTITVTYPGIEFLWQGSDPDSRLSNIIPLEYSFALVNAETGDTMALPLYNDSSRFIGYQPEGTWSGWVSNTQTVLYGYPTGNYNFFLRVRDDGLTESSVIALAEFYAIKPARDKFMLVIDGNKELAAIDRILLGREPDSIMAFYNGMIEDAWNLAELLRQSPLVDPMGVIPPMGNFSEEVDIWENRTDDPIPYDLIHHYEFVWMIDDDNAGIDGGRSEARKLVLQDFMNVGGHFMLSGRRVFNGPFAVNPGEAVPSFFRDYFDLTSMQAKPRVSLSNPSADFGGCAVGNSGLLPLVLDSTVMAGLRLGNNVLECLPEVEWFGRAVIQQGLDFSTTVLNYVSCTANDSFDIYDQDLAVLESSTPTVAILNPPPEQNRIIDVLRVYNVTKDVFGDYMYTEAHESGGIPDPRIYVSTPANAGTWVDDDLLQVDFIYIPISEDHDQPTAERFARMDGIIEINIIGGETQIRVRGVNRFKTSLYTFPLSFIDNTPQMISWAPEAGPVGPVTLLLATDFLWIKQPVDFEFDRGL